MQLAVSEIAVYPVKSLAGVYPSRAELVETGFRHDREWMVVNEQGYFLTQREHPRMARIRTSTSDAGLRLEVPGHPPLSVPVVEQGDRRTVRVWEDRCTAVDQGDAAAELLSDYLGRPCRLVRMPRGARRELGDHYRVVPEMHVGFADSAPFLIISRASLDDLNARLETPVSMSRFRPNIVVDGGQAFQEDGWHRIRIGETPFRVVRDCIRCEIITVDQDSGAKGVEPMETLGTYRYGPRGIRFGRKMVHEAVGTIRLGDPVEVLS
jgi:hypothetical protein